MHKVPFGQEKDFPYLKAFIIRKRDKTFYHVVFNHYGFLPTLYRVEKNHFHETVVDKYGTSYYIVG